MTSDTRIGVHPQCGPGIGVHPQRGPEIGVRLLCGPLKGVRLMRFPVVLLILTNCCTSTQAQENPQLRELAEEFWDWQLHEFPDTFNLKANHLESFLVADFHRRVADCRSMHERTLAVDTRTLSRQDGLTLKLLQYQLNSFIKGSRWAEYGALNPLNMLESVHRLSYNWVSRTEARTVQDLEDFVAKLHLIPAQVAQVQDLLAKAIQLNRTNYNTSMRGIVGELEELTTRPAYHTFYYQQLSKLMKDVPNITESSIYTIDSNGQRAIESIQSALARLLSFVTERYLPHTRSEPGVWQLDNGHDYYRHALQWYLSLNISPEQVYRTGLKEVSRIMGLMKVILVSLGYGGDVKSFLQELKSKPEFYNHTEEEYLKLYEKTVTERIPPRLPQLFNNMGDIPQIRVVPVNSPDVVAAAYGGGKVFINNHNQHTRPNFTVLAISLHEGSPGHHLQMSKAALQDLPTFRRSYNIMRKYVVPFGLPYYSAYVEGWGLYAEYLGHELGLYNDDPYELFGRYCYELFRACRLVVDTGIHVKGWTREQAIDYLEVRSISSHENVAFEIDRYITWPGQACSYKIGEMKILELRRRAEASLYPYFNVRDFHDVILHNGPVPLDMLEDIVDEYINRSLTSAGVSIQRTPALHNAVIYFTSLFVSILFVYSKWIPA